MAGRMTGGVVQITFQTRIVPAPKHGTRQEDKTMLTTLLDTSGGEYEKH